MMVVVGLMLAVAPRVFVPRLGAAAGTHSRGGTILGAHPIFGTHRQAAFGAFAFARLAERRPRLASLISREEDNGSPP